MLIPEFLRDLQVDPLRHPRGQGHLSSASGLVRVQRHLYVVADDELHLGRFGNTGQAPVELIRLFDGKLPNNAKKRKKTKLDIETLLQLPAMPGYPFGALMALGSGSSPKRCQAVLVPLDAKGALIHRLAYVDFAPLYARLRRSFDDLNIEGAFLSQGRLCLLQRGNKGNSPSACIRFEWKSALPWLTGKREDCPPVVSITLLDLGRFKGVPLSPTDGAALAGGQWAFSAAAEDTDNSIQDGPCLASAVGIVDADGAVRQIHRLRGAPKVEGISVMKSQGLLVMKMVTDADNASEVSQLLRVQFPAV